MCSVVFVKIFSEILFQGVFDSFVYFLPRGEKRSGRRGAAIESYFAQNAFQKRDRLFFSDKRRAEFACAHVFDSFVKSVKPNAFVRFAVLRRIHRIAVAGRGEVVARAVEIGIYKRNRVLRVVEVVAPVQKAFDVVFEQLKTYTSRACARHCEKAIADVFALATAVVRPQIFYARVQKRMNSVGCDDRKFNYASFVKIVMRQRVHNRISVK